MRSWLKSEKKIAIFVRKTSCTICCLFLGKKIGSEGNFFPIFKPIVEYFENNKICAHWVHFEFKNGPFICVFYMKDKK